MQDRGTIKSSLGKFEGPSLTSRFDSVITKDNNIALFNYSIKAKLQAEIELFLKYIVYENADQIYRKFGFESPEIDHLFKLANPSTKETTQEMIVEKPSNTELAKKYSYLLPSERKVMKQQKVDPL